MNGSLFLAWHYLRRNTVLTGVLTAALTLIIFLPAVLLLVLDGAARHLMARADSTPLLLGAKGSPLELVLGSIYFHDPAPGIIPKHRADDLRHSQDGLVVPLHTGRRVRGHPLIGTSAEYFSFRGLEPASGALNDIPGECVVGAKVARLLAVAPGDTIDTSDARAFELSEAPLRLQVVGVLKETDSPDDEALFVDLKTIWIMEGLGHGHLEEEGHGSASAKYTLITPENLEHFHFHGDQDEFPITAVIVQPKDLRARALLRDRYVDNSSEVHLVQPAEVMEDLLATIVRIRQYVVALVGLVSLVTLAVVGLVIALSLRLRRGEIETMRKIGCARATVLRILACQLGIVILTSLLLAGLLTALASAYGEDILNWLVLS